MDYLHLSTADVAILKGSWAVLEEHVTRVGVDFFLDLINNHEEIRSGIVKVDYRLLLTYVSIFNFSVQTTAPHPCV